MPEPYWPKRKNAYHLSHAERDGSMAVIRCVYCKTVRYYLPADLIKVFGDLECDEVIHRHRWRCTHCGKSHTIEMDLAVPSAADHQNGIVRRLVRIDTIKRPVWRDEAQ